MKLTANPSHRTDQHGTKHGAEYHCPISTLEMNGRHKFGYILTTGTVLSDRAIQQLIKSSHDQTIIDPSDEKKYNVGNIIYINLEEAKGNLKRETPYRKNFHTKMSKKNGQKPFI